MNTVAVTLLEDAARAGVVIHAEGGRLVARPKGTLPTSLEKEIREHRADVLALVAAAVAPPKAACWNCRGTRFFARPERFTWVCAHCHPPAAPATMVWHEVAAESRDA